jgi:hypothetical protein
MERFMSESCVLKITLNGSAPVKMFFHPGMKRIMPRCGLVWQK